MKQDSRPGSCVPQKTRDKAKGPFWAPQAKLRLSEHVPLWPLPQAQGSDPDEDPQGDPQPEMLFPHTPLLLLQPHTRAGTLTWDQALRSAAAICRSLVLSSRESTGIWGRGGLREERGPQGGHLILLGPAAPLRGLRPGSPGTPHTAASNSTPDLTQEKGQQALRLCGSGL